MAAGFKELDGITADLGIEAWGETLEKAFTHAALGLSALVTELPQNSDTIRRTIHIQAPSLPDLLVKYLNEIIYLEEVDGFLLCDIPDLKISDPGLTPELDLAATLTGTIFDPDRHSINTHIKAATYHGLAIEEKPGELRVRVIFDV